MARYFTQTETDFLLAHRGNTTMETAELFNRHFGTSYSITRIRDALRHRGIKSHRRDPLGAERTIGGYMCVKIGEGKWERKHTLIWESAHGKVPDGHAVIFADGDALNCTLENLLCVSRQELITMNRLGYITGSRELTYTGKLLAAAILKIGERQKRRKSTRTV